MTDFEKQAKLWASREIIAQDIAKYGPISEEVMTDVQSKYREMIAEDAAKLLNVCDKYKGMSVPELRAIAKETSNPFAVCLLNITGDLNTGMIIRSASLFGAEKAIVFGRRKFDARSLVGVQNYIEIDKVSGFIDDTTELDFFKFKETIFDAGYFPILVDGPGFTPIDKFPWEDTINAFKNLHLKPCLVFGNEGQGIPEEWIWWYSTRIVSIPQRGVLRSFNVSAAANIVMYHLCQQMKWL